MQLGLALPFRVHPQVLSIRDQYQAAVFVSAGVPFERGGQFEAGRGLAY